MTRVNDYFFGDYITPQEKRLRAVTANGIQHASDISPNDPQPGDPVTLTIIADATLPIDHVAVYYTTDGANPVGALGHAIQGEVILAHLAPADDQPTGGDSQLQHIWRARIPGQPDGVLVRYHIDAWNSENPEQRWLADTYDPFAAPAPAGREFAYHVDTRQPPDWIYDAIVYHIFVDRFATASDQPPMRSSESLTEFYGGTIRGITEKLDYITRLGVNCLWLSPVMESPTYHSYNPSSYRDVSKRFGTNADLRELIAAAHARGMRVLLDFVANHTSNEHPAFVAAEQGDTPQRNEWYTFSPEYRNGYLTFYDVRAMPVLRTDNAPVREYLIDAARYWITEFGADGFRLDNVSGPAHAFWTFFQEGVKATHPDALTLGEVTGSMRDITSYAGRLDACMDFPLVKVIRRVFAQRESTLDQLLTRLIQHATEFPESLARALLLDNHDMHRFLWLAENDTRRLKLALAFLMVLPGFPVIYYGAEVGLSQRDGPDGKDAYAREPMPWGDAQQRDVLEHFRWLIERRRETAALRRGQMARIPTQIIEGEHDQVGALMRWDERTGVILICNNSEAPARFTLDHTQLPPPADDKTWGAIEPTNIWLLEPEGIRPFTEITAPQLTGALPPMSAVMAILQPKPKR